MAEILIARRSFILRRGGKQIHVYRGDHAHADHDVVAAIPDAFRPLNVKFSTEQASKRSKRSADEVLIP